VHPADIQDRDGGRACLSTLFGLYPFLQSSLLMADIGPVFQKASAKILPHLQNRNRQTLRSGKRVRASAATLGCRTHFSLGLIRARRLAKDFENLARNALAFLHLASIRLMLRNFV